MACFNVLFVALLIAGFGSLVLLCFERANIDHPGPISGGRFENGKEDAGLQVTETYPDLEDVDRLLFPRESNGFPRNQNRWRANGDQQSRNLVHRKDSTAKPNTPGIRVSAQSTRSLKRGTTKNHEDPFDPKAVLECMLQAIQTSLPTVVSYTTAVPTNTLLDRVASILRTTPAVQPPTVAISEDMVESFVEATEQCFALLPHDKSGKITLPEDFETSPAAEAIKQQPMGLLTLGAVRAVADNVVFSRRKKPQYNVNNEGLAHGLEMAAVKTKQIGQIVLKSPEGISWFTKDVSQNAKETAIEQDKTSAHDIPIAIRKQTPSTVINLLQCILNAAKATLPIGVLANNVLGTFRKQLSTIPTVGFIFQKSNEAANESSQETSSVISAKTLEAFVKEVSPCLPLFTKNEEGKLELDPSFLKSAAIEVARLNPIGALAIGIARALSENVLGTEDEEGKTTYSINYEGLTTGLGLAVMDATKFGRVLRFCSHIATIKLRK